MHSICGAKNLIILFFLVVLSGQRLNFQVFFVYIGDDSNLYPKIFTEFE